jgi:hypothetical protein
MPILERNMSLDTVTRVCTKASPHKIGRAYNASGGSMGCEEIQLWPNKCFVFHDKEATSPNLG